VALCVQLGIEAIIAEMAAEEQHAHEKKTIVDEILSKPAKCCANLCESANPCGASGRHIQQAAHLDASTLQRGRSTTSTTAPPQQQ